MNLNNLKYEEPTIEEMTERFECSKVNFLSFIPMSIRHCIAAGCNVGLLIEEIKGTNIKTTKLIPTTKNPTIVIQHDDHHDHSQIYVYESITKDSFHACKFRWNRH